MPSPEKKADAEQADLAQEQEISTWFIDDWCAHRSSSLGTRIESLSGFNHVMREAGKLRLSLPEFETEYQKFLTAPAGRKR